MESQAPLMREIDVCAPGLFVQNSIPNNFYSKQTGQTATITETTQAVEFSDYANTGMLTQVEGRWKRDVRHTHTGCGTKWYGVDKTILKWTRRTCVGCVNGIIFAYENCVSALLEAEFSTENWTENLSNACDAAKTQPARTSTKQIGTGILHMLQCVASCLWDTNTLRSRTFLYKIHFWTTFVWSFF